MLESNTQKVIVLGIGGKAAYFVVKYILLSGIAVEGYDLKESKNTQELENMGVKINYRNPKEGERLDCDLLLYSHDLPLALQERILGENKGVKSIELGKFYKSVVKEYEEGKMSNEQEEVLKESELAPLFQIDTSKMKYIAVTGTDGKTSTCSMLYHLFKREGLKPALITTVAAYIGDKKLDTGLHTTTPSSQEMYELLQKIEEEKCTHVIVEATSHGLEQGRLLGLKFNTVGYTNITSEHLDYHKDWEGYAHAKSLLITENLANDGKVVLNKDDKSYVILKELSKEHIDYSIEKKATLYATDIKEDIDGINFKINKNNQEYPAYLPILGRYNVSNFLCAIAISLEEGLDITSLIEDIKSFQTVRGRMEILQKEPFTVIVDYAHTTNSTKVALQSARALLKSNGNLIHIFGSAGHRDVYKRYGMGKVSNEIADITILTAEDPRLEDLKDINNEIERGWKEGGNRNKQLYRFDFMDKNTQVRIDAIKKGLELVKEGDVIIITGKAHEQSLCFGQIEYPWDDIEETKKLL